jgi:hypothetical protein
MNIRQSIGLACAGLLVTAGASCAGSSKEQRSDNPTASAAQESQKQSEEALKSAHDAQKQASDQGKKAALSQADRQAAQGRMSTRGTVTQASDDELVLRPRSGSQAMTFKVDDRTQVRIDGRQAFVSDIKQGQDALVSYAPGGPHPSALTVQVVTGEVGGTAQGTGSAGASSGTGPASTSSR